MNDKPIIIFMGFFLILGLIFTLQKPVDLSYITNSQVETISFEHNQVHRGNLWSIYDYDIIPSTSNSSFIFKTGNKSVHIIFQFQNQYEAQFWFCENITVTDNGTRLEYYNRNRNYLGENGVETYIDGEFSSCETVFGRARLGDGRQTGGNDRSINEYVLRSNTYYAVWIENIANQPNVINYYFEWYEGK